MTNRAIVQQAPLAAPVPVGTMLAAFGEFMRLDVARGDPSPETVRTYWSQLRAFLGWCEHEGLEPALVTHEDLKAYRASLISKGLARATVAGRLNAVRRFYDMAQARGYRPDNPARGLRAPKDLSDRAERVKWLPLPAIQRLLDAPDPATVKGARDRAILMLLTIHGLRRMEVAHLRIEDVDLQAMVITPWGKGRKRRRVPLVAESADALRGWLDLRDDVAADGETAVFVSTRDGGRGNSGRRMSRRMVSKLVNGYLRALGLKRPGISCHALRHSYATLSLAAGARLDVISRTLGHSSITTTQIYADIVDMGAQNPARFLCGALEAL